MHLSAWFLFVGVSLFMAFTPGPAVLLAISNSLALGPRRAMLGSLGNAAGIFMVSGATMAGLGVLLMGSATAFMALKLAGAGYLVYLGIKQWRRASSPFVAAAATQASRDAAAHPRARLLGQGLMVALTNPKSVLFFSALFPQFIRPDTPVIEQFMVLTTTFAACTVFSHAVYVLLARSLRRHFENPTHARLINRVGGGLFVLLGLGLLQLRAKAA